MALLMRKMLFLISVMDLVRAFVLFQRYCYYNTGETFFTPVYHEGCCLFCAGQQSAFLEVWTTATTIDNGLNSSNPRSQRENHPDVGRLDPSVSVCG
jgi:hypothetical protein